MAIFDAALLIDLGTSAQGDGRTIFLPGRVWHGTPRHGSAGGKVRNHGLVAFALISNEKLAPKQPAASPPRRASPPPSPRATPVPPLVAAATPPPAPPQLYQPDSS